MEGMRPQRILRPATRPATRPPAVDELHLGLAARVVRRLALEGPGDVAGDGAHIAALGARQRPATTVLGGLVEEDGEANILGHMEHRGGLASDIAEAAELGTIIGAKDHRVAHHLPLRVAVQRGTRLARTLLERLCAVAGESIKAPSGVSLVAVKI